MVMVPLSGRPQLQRPPSIRKTEAKTCELFGAFRIRAIPLLWAIRSGSTDDSTCPFGVTVPVLLLIILKVPVMLGPESKLLTLLPSRKFVFPIIILSLQL